MQCAICKTVDVEELKAVYLTGQDGRVHEYGVCVNCHAKVFEENIHEL